MAKGKTMRFTADAELEDAIIHAADFREYEHNTTVYVRKIIVERLIKDGFLIEEETSKNKPNDLTLKNNLTITENISMDQESNMETLPRQQNGTSESPNNIFD